MKSRVVVTGMGVVSPIGIGVDNFWNSILEGKSGIGKIESDAEWATIARRGASR